MDQNSSNGSGPDKRNWRERLGIGGKELPKLSDEFRDEPAVKPPPAAGTAKPAPRAPQPVTKPAPMAPRAPARAPAPAAPPPAAAAPSPPPAAPSPRATPKGPDNAAQDALAEKLRAQRAAAEKLAEQRVQAARERAEGKSAPQPAEPTLAQPKPAAPPPPSRPAAPAPSAAPAVPSRPAVPPPPMPGARPKFSFADDSQRSAAGASAPPLTPPRPALGGERGQPPFLRPGTPNLGGRPQPPYRPVEPSAGYTPPPRLQPPGAGRPGAEAPSYPGARVPARRSPPLDPYARQSDPRDLGDEDYPDEGRAVPRLGRPGAPARGRAAQEDYEEVFEDEAPRPRASARDYQAAYRDGEEAFGDEGRRSGGPWLLLLALLAAALVTGGVVWYYNTKMKDNVAGTGSSSGSVPVVSAPEDPAKVAPEPTAEGTGDAPAAKKKQIYDRIVGEQEVIGGQMQPTEETPMQPGDAQPTEAQPADQVPAIEPAAGTNQIPAPDAPSQGTAGEGLPAVDEPPPLPLPPAGGGEQGSLDQQGIGRVAAASAQPEQGATAPPAPPAAPSAQTTSSAALPLPPPEKATDGAALVSGDSNPPAAAAPADTVADATAVDDGGSAEPAPAPPPPKKKQATAKKKAQPAEKKSQDLGGEPVVLVPPSEPPAQADTQVATNEPATQPAIQTEPVKKKRTLMDLLRGGNDVSATPDTGAGTQVAAAPQATRSAAPPPAEPAQPAQKASTGGGYVIQLSSFRSEAEARKEYGRLSQLYPSVIGGLPERINQTSVGGSTRYQLGLGPLASRSDATRVCSALFTAGESDCIVRGP